MKTTTIAVAVEVTPATTTTKNTTNGNKISVEFTTTGPNREEKLFTDQTSSKC